MSSEDDDGDAPTYVPLPRRYESRSPLCNRSRDNEFMARSSSDSFLPASSTGR